MSLTGIDTDSELQQALSSEGCDILTTTDNAAPQTADAHFFRPRNVFHSLISNNGKRDMLLRVTV